MANNVQITAGSGTTIETIDEGGGVERQVIVLGSIGDASGETQLSGGQKTSANSIPVVLASDQSAVPVSGTFWQTTQPVSGTVTANAGTNLNTSALALESGGNLATVASAQGASGSGITQPTGGSGILGWLSGIYKAITSTLTVSGTVAVSGTVPVSGTFYQATQPISATSLPLPTGAATSANQSTIIGDLGTINTTLGSPFQAGGALGAGSNTIGATYRAPTSSSSFAIAPVVAASATNVVGKASAGNLYEALVNVGSTAGYVFKFNATSVPANGAVTAGAASGDYQDCVYVPAYGTYSWSAGGDPPESFSAGITIAFSSTGPGTFTAATASFLRARVQ